MSAGKQQKQQTKINKIKYKRNKTTKVREQQQQATNTIVKPEIGKNHFKFKRTHKYAISRKEIDNKIHI